MMLVMDRARIAGPLSFAQNYAVSDTATELFKEQYQETLISYLQSERSRISHHAYASYIKALQEGGKDDWDGYGASAIKIQSWLRALRFARLLPAETPLPDIYMDTDGEATFEWYKSPRQVFSVTLTGNKDLAYAGLFGLNKTHGVEQELDDELPGPIVESIYRVYS